jgi:hypothetical protein
MYQDHVTIMTSGGWWCAECFVDDKIRVDYEHILRFGDLIDRLDAYAFLCRLERGTIGKAQMALELHEIVLRQDFGQGDLDKILLDKILEE